MGHQEVRGPPGGWGSGDPLGGGGQGTPWGVGGRGPLGGGGQGTPWGGELEKLNSQFSKSRDAEPRRTSEPGGEGGILLRRAASDAGGVRLGPGVQRSTPDEVETRLKGPLHCLIYEMSPSLQSAPPRGAGTWWAHSIAF